MDALTKTAVYVLAYIIIHLLLGGEVIDSNFKNYLLVIILYEVMKENYRGKEERK